MVITILVSISAIVNASINETNGIISFTDPEPIVNSNSEKPSVHNNQNGSWLPNPPVNVSDSKPEDNQTQLSTENETYPSEGNETDPSSGNESYFGPILELFTMQEKGFNDSGYGVKEIRWLSDNALMINVGVWVNCGLNLVDGFISLDNLTLNLMYVIGGNESDMLRCNSYFDLYYIISNIEQSDFANIELLPELDIK